MHVGFGGEFMTTFINRFWISIKEVSDSYPTMVMPTLIGGFLRHGRITCVSFDLKRTPVSFNVLTDFVSDLIFILYESLSAGGVSNEAVSEGCAKWGKVQNV